MDSQVCASFVPEQQKGIKNFTIYWLMHASSEQPATVMTAYRQLSI